MRGSQQSRYDQSGQVCPPPKVVFLWPPVGRQLRCRAARFARGMGPDKVWQGNQENESLHKLAPMLWSPFLARARSARRRRVVDGRRASTILCSRSGGDAREAMTVGCKPTIASKAEGGALAGLRGSFLRFPPIGMLRSNKA